MAHINVNEVLSDPDFIDTISIITRTPTVSSFGENSLSEVTLTSVGCVQPASGRAINRLPDALRVANVSSFWFKGVIVASEVGHYSSIVVFKGQRFQVQTVQDWSNWGEGWCEGTCVAEVPAP